ncbi:MAG: hypothetical protein NC218_06950 [Acetobacter sp.]|nr:hypothetical protein [Acetobacter sp.]
MSAKIGIDFHGVIDAQPELFAAFCREIRKLGVQVYIISGGPEKDVARCLQEHRIEYDGLWAILDYYETQGKVQRFDDGSFQVPTELWNRAKAEFCAREGIKFHIDDSPVYGKYFASSYCQYNMANDVCALEDGVEIDFKETTEAVYKVAALLKGECAE